MVLSPRHCGRSTGTKLSHKCKRRGLNKGALPPLLSQEIQGKTGRNKAGSHQLNKATTMQMLKIAKSCQAIAQHLKIKEGYDCPGKKQVKLPTGTVVVEMVDKNGLYFSDEFSLTFHMHYYKLLKCVVLWPMIAMLACLLFCGRMKVRLSLHFQEVPTSFFSGVT